MPAADGADIRSLRAEPVGREWTDLPHAPRGIFDQVHIYPRYARQIADYVFNHSLHPHPIERGAPRRRRQPDVDPTALAADLINEAKFDEAEPKIRVADDAELSITPDQCSA